MLNQGKNNISLVPSDGGIDVLENRENIESPLSNDSFKLLMNDPNGSFENMDLSEIDFQQLRQEGYKNFENRCFDGCKFNPGQKLTPNFVFNGSSFRNIEGQGVEFADSQYNNCDFSGAKLEGADFTCVGLEGARFNGANLRNSMIWDWGGVNIDFSDADITGATTMPPFHAQEAYEVRGKNKILGLKVNDGEFDRKEIPIEKLSVDMEQASSIFRCGKAEVKFSEFCHKKAVFKFKGQVFDFAVNIFNLERKFSLIPNKNIDLCNGSKLWKNCLYTLRNSDIRDRIIEFCGQENSGEVIENDLEEMESSN